MSKQKYELFPLLLALYEMALYLSNDAYLPAIPQIASEFATTNSMTQLTLTLWFLGGCSTQLFLGPISDRYGRRPVLLWGGVGFMLSTILCAFASSINLLLFARLIQGMAIPSVVIAGYATIHELYDQHKAIKTLSLMNSITVLAPSFGPLLGGILLTIVDWRWLFGILAIWSVITIIGLFKQMPETLAPETKHPIELKRTLKVYVNVIFNSGYMLRTLIFCSSFGAMIMWICASPFLIIEKFHYTLVEYGLFQAFVFGSFIVGSRAITNLLPRLGVKRLIQIGVGLGLLSSLIMSASGVIQPEGLYTTTTMMMVLAFGSGLMFPTLNRLAIESCDQPMGARMAIFSALGCFFGALGSLFAGFWGTNLTSFSFVVLGFFVVCTALYWTQRHYAIVDVAHSNEEN